VQEESIRVKGDIFRPIESATLSTTRKVHQRLDK
jgi:hypothetical protein